MQATYTSNNSEAVSGTELRELKVGRSTLYEGKRGRWCRVSWPMGSEDMVAMLRGEITSEEYAKRLKQDCRDKRRAFDLMGEPARGFFGRLKLSWQFRKAL